LSAPADLPGTTPPPPVHKLYKRSYRVKGIDPKYNRDSFRGLLEKLIGLERASQITVHSLAKAPTEQGSRDAKITKTATISFKEDLESELNEKIKGSSARDINNLTLDRNFLGLTPLNSEDDNCNIE
jgi:hypothetical protein